MLNLTVEKYQEKRKWIIIGVVLTVLLQFACIMPYGKLFGADVISPEGRITYMWISRFLFWIMLGGIFLFAIRVEKNSALPWKENKYSLGIYIAFFLITFLAVSLTLTIVSLVIRLAGYSSESPGVEFVQSLLTHHPLLAIFTCATAAVVEEFIFRGYLLPRLELLLKNRWVAIVISSIFFGLLHFGFGTVINVIGPFIIGIIFAIHYSYFRNLKFLIFFHFFWDIMALYSAQLRGA